MPGRTGARDAVPKDADWGRAESPRWLRLGLTALVGAVAGATLFAKEAQGRAEARRPEERG